MGSSNTMILIINDKSALMDRESVYMAIGGDHAYDCCLMHMGLNALATNNNEEHVASLYIYYILVLLLCKADRSKDEMKTCLLNNSI